MKPARYSDAGSTFCGPVGSGTSKTTGNEGEKLEGRVEEKEVVVVERKAVKKMRVLVFYLKYQLIYEILMTKTKGT